MKSQASWIKPSSRAFAIAVLLVLPLLYFYPVLTGEIALVQGDGWSQNLGPRVLIGRMLAAGQLPLWNPYIFGGMPLLASIYPGALYPPNWVFALLPPGAAMHIVVITTYHVALIGSYLYGRRIGMTRAGAILSGVVFTFGGYMISHLGHTSRIAAGAWLPWILLAFEHLYLEFKAPWVISGAVFIALQLLAGEPQMTFYTVMVVGAYFLFSLLFRECPSRARFTAGVVIVSAGGLLLSMIQLLPERELLKLGERAAISYEYFSGYSFPPRQILTFIMPFFFGGSPQGVSYWGEWTIGEACGYTGLLAVLLTLIGFSSRENRSQIWFWTLIAAASLILSFGDYLPFRWNTLLHQIPVYSLFRASGRHLFEFDFSIGVLAGLGLTFLSRTDAKVVRRAFGRATFIFVTLFLVTILLYRFSGSWLTTTTPRPAGADSLLTFEGLAPVVFFLLTTLAVWIYTRTRTKWAALVLIAVAFVDLGHFGHHFYWRETRMNIDARLADPDTVSFIKEREQDLHSFRIVSYSTLPFYVFVDDRMNFPNSSIPRGLESVNGYDALRLPRPAEIAGRMTIDGQIEDSSLFSDLHQGLNLLNVKYLFYLPPAPINESRAFIADGIRFEPGFLNWNLKPESRITLTRQPTYATSVAFVTTMANAIHVVDGTPVARITLKTSDGRSIQHEIQAGRDTSEWAYDRDPSGVRHRRAKVAETWKAGGFDGHRYLSKFDFPRAQIVSTEIEYLLHDASLIILRASYVDQQNGTSISVDTLTLEDAKWKKLGTFGAVEIYENLRVRPRAWFVSRVQAATSAEVAEAIRTGVLKGGAHFDPAETAVLALEDFGGGSVKLPPVGEPGGAEARVVGFEPQRIVIETNHSGPGFLVLSEMYYRGWEAWVDGTRVPVERVDYTLRGIALTGGKQRVEMIFKAHSFRTGAVYSGVGALGLFVCALLMRYRSRTLSREE